MLYAFAIYIIFQDSNTNSTDGSSNLDQGEAYIRKYSFTQRTVAIWNNLPSKVVTAPTVMSFWENQPRKYNYSHEIVINTT